MLIQVPFRSPSLVVSFIAGVTCLAGHAAEPVYLDHIWEHRGPGLNLIRTAEGPALAVDDEGRHLADSSIMPDVRHQPFRFETLQRLADGFHLARNLGNHGFDWFRISDGTTFLDREALEASIESPRFRSAGFLLDPDPLRGDSGLAVFPDGGLALLCGRHSPGDSRISEHYPISGNGQPEPFADRDDVGLPVTQVNSSVRAEDLPDRVVLDPTGNGFWYLGTTGQGGSREFVIVHATPGRRADGSRTLNLTKPITVGRSGPDRFETAVAIGDDLLLLLATEDPAIGGYQAERRLLRVNRTNGIAAEATLRFDHFLPEARAAAMGGKIALHSPDDLVLLDAATLAPVWRKSAADLLGENPLGHRIARIAANPEGTMLAVAFDTPLRRPGEPNRLLLLKPDAGATLDVTLRPAPLDHMHIAADGGVLVFTPAYTAKIGGNTPVAENEKAAVAKSIAAASPAPSPAAPAIPPAEFSTTPAKDRHKLWFDAPAPGYGTKSLPIGNGHLGAMLTGGIDTESVTFNVDSMWQGDNQDMGQYQAFGVLNITLGHDPKQATGYRRELDLRTGLHTVTYQHGGVTYRREAFASYPHGILGIRLSADKPGTLSGSIGLLAMHAATITKSATGMEFAGALPNDRKFQATLQLHTQGGRVLPEKGESGTRIQQHRRQTDTMPYDSIVLENCDEIILYLAADTDFAFAPENNFLGAAPAEKIAPRLAHTKQFGFDQLRDASAADVSALFDRCTIEIATPNPAAEALPIDQRRAAYRNGAIDPGLETLAFDAVRHMIIACSRPGSLPANLQGIWNDSNRPAWTSDYHADLNVQMAYWFVDPTNLAECNIPLFDYIESQIPFRREAAKRIFGANVRGWTVDYMNGIFGAGGYKNYPPGSAWYAWHFADHFKFTQDGTFLETRAYPVLKELSEHWQDLLIARPDGRLVTPKTMSPEHKPAQFGISQDVQLVHSLFGDFLNASRRLDRDAAFRTEVADMRGRLVPLKIGRWGQLQEWEPDRDSRYGVHRHFNHMIAAFPANQICPSNDPELAAAVVTGLEARGIGETGWAKSWRVALFARMGMPELVERQMRATLGDFHDHLIWQSKSQIDAPAGYAAGVAEALLQSHETLADDDSRFLIHLLPALPPAWQHGRAHGLRARGGFEVDLEWENGRLTQAKIRGIANTPKEITLRSGTTHTRLTLRPGTESILTPANFE